MIDPWQGQQLLSGFELKERLKAEIALCGNLSAWATKHRLHRSYVKRVVEQQTIAGDRIAKALGYRRDYFYFNAKTPEILLTSADFRMMLRVSLAGSNISRWTRERGISRNELYKTLRNVRGIQPGLYLKLGYREVVMFERAGPEATHTQGVYGTSAKGRLQPA